MLTWTTKCQSEGRAELERDSKGTPTTVVPQSSASERNISLVNTCQSQGGGPDLGYRMTTPTLGDPLSSVMSTPVNTCQTQGGIQLENDSTGPPTPVTPSFSVSKRYISSGNTCQSQGGSGLECDSTTTPTPAAPLSLRESVIKVDIPALPATAHFGYVAVVNGDTTLSCPSPPTFTTGDFGRPCTTATPVSADSERNISPVIT
jgi:hypothetical protein